MTIGKNVGIYTNMSARLLFKRRIVVAEAAFVELIAWQLTQPVQGCRHLFKYRLALVAGGRCVLRYDNEQGKGDHRHLGSEECPYQFSTTEQLLADFKRDVARWIDENPS